MSDKIRISLLNNAKRTQASVVMLSSVDRDSWFQQLQTLAKNKLKLKASKRFFVQLDKTCVVQVGSQSDFAHLPVISDSKIFVSCGEDFVGKERVLSVLEFLDSSQDRSEAEVRFLHQKSHVDAAAESQLRKTALLPGMHFCVGMPDLHAGNQFPIGAVFAVENQVYPALIGGDIGCGMVFYETTMTIKQLVGRELKVASQLVEMEGPWDPQDCKAMLHEANVAETPFDKSLGTIGRGNHFAELQIIETIVDETLFNELELSKDRAYLLVHSGSRGLGRNVLERHIGVKSETSLQTNTVELEAYLKDHDHACLWAKVNRRVIAKRIFHSLNLDMSQQRPILDIWHNNVELKQLLSGKQVYLHRKGAAPSDKGLIIVPGSRGTFTYLVKPVGNQESNGFSVAHGAGREKSRTKSSSAQIEGKFANKKSMIESLTVNSFGGVTVCEDVDLLCEEAPDAYKDITDIIEDLVQNGVIRVVAIMKPLVTYKMRHSSYGDDAD